MASPFFDKTFTFTQPDGMKFEVRGSGDQHYAAFETLDGYAVVKNPSTGFFEIAQVSSHGTMLEPTPGPQGNLDGKRAAVRPGLRINRDTARARGMEGTLRIGGRRCDQRREQTKNLIREAGRLGGHVMAPPVRETVGNVVGLCLLIDFSDETGMISRDEVEKFCNEPEYSGFGNNGSVFDYFSDNSIGRCRNQTSSPTIIRHNIPGRITRTPTLHRAFAHMASALYDSPRAMDADRPRGRYLRTPLLGLGCRW